MALIQHSKAKTKGIKERQTDRLAERERERERERVRDCLGPLCRVVI